MPVATMTVQGSAAFSFLVASTPQGWPIDQASIVEEELLSPGVDGRRWRTESLQQVDIDMSTIDGCDTYEVAISTGRLYRRMVGLIGQLSVTIAGTSHQWNRVHIAGAMPRAHSGKISGAGASASSTAFIMCDWKLVIMNIDAIATA